MAERGMVGGVTGWLSMEEEGEAVEESGAARGAKMDMICC